MYRAEYVVREEDKAEAIAELAGEAVRNYLDENEARIEEGAQIDIDVRRLTGNELKQECMRTGWSKEEREEWGERVRKVTFLVSKPKFKPIYSEPVRLEDYENM